MYVPLYFSDIGSSRKDVQSFCTALEEKAVCAHSTHLQLARMCWRCLLGCVHVESLPSNCTGKTRVPDCHTGEQEPQIPGFPCITSCWICPVCVQHTCRGDYKFA